MASITIRDLEDAVKERLRVRAAQHGRSMEEEARSIVRSAVMIDETPPLNLAESIRRRFASVNGVELPEVPRDVSRDPPRFDE